MNGTTGGTITVGTRLSFDGGLWEVTELTATAVVLRDALVLQRSTLVMFMGVLGCCRGGIDGGPACSAVAQRCSAGTSAEAEE